MSIDIIRQRIFSHLTKTRFLHVEDAILHGKLRFFIGSFERGKGASSTAYAFMDIDDARVVFSDMSWGKAVDFVDYKGGRDGSGAVISRVLKIKTKEDASTALGDPSTSLGAHSLRSARVWIDLQNGAGEELGEGAVKPVEKPFVDISIPLTIFEGRKMALAILAYLHAWEVARVISNQWSVVNG